MALAGGPAATPGSRFIARYEARSHIPRLHPRRLGRVLLGLGLFTIGMLNVFVPGPGGSIFILGSALALSSESRTFARLLDWGEVRFQRQIRVVLDRPVIATATISVLVILAVFVVGKGVAAVVGADSATAVSSSEAAEIVGARVDVSPRLQPGLRPAPGTYEYEGRGTDSFDLGRGTTREFPRVTNVVVQLQEDGCAWTADIVFIEEHVEHRTFCTTAGGVEDTGFARTTTFLGHEQTSSYECTSGAWRTAANLEVGERWRYRCTERRGGVVHYAAQRLADAQLTIGNTRVRAAHVTLRGSQRGRSTGAEHSEFWLLDTGMPARLKSTRSLTVRTPIGDMTSRETFDYALRSLEPVATAR